jgi:membrane-associated phospholipid phosphatase
MPRFRTACLLLLAAPVAACSRTPEADPAMVAEWMHTFYGVVRSERIGPPVASRLLAYASIAMHEGLAAATPGMLSLSGAANGLPTMPATERGVRYDPTIVAVTAERTLLDSLLGQALPSTKAILGRLADSLVADRMANGTEEEMRERSEQLGAAIGNTVVGWARSDGFTETRSRAYTPPVGEGLWGNDRQPHLGATQSYSGATEFVGLDNPANALRPGSASDRNLVMSRPRAAGSSELPALNIVGITEPYWGTIRPFMLRSWNECPIQDPPAYSTDPESEFYRQALAVVEAQRNLTPEQRTIALYWADNPGETGTPAGHWLAIAGQMVSQRNLSAPQAARLFVATATSIADAFIAVWGYKFQYNLIRPRPYIRAHIDSTWEPMITSPPFPEFPSGHSSQSGAAAAAIVGLIGDGPFEDSTSMAIGHEVRRFGSFHEAAEEAMVSRLYGGIHYPIGNSAGAEVGLCIGHLVAERIPR